MVKPKAKREAVSFIKASFGLSNRHGCFLIGLSRSTQRYQPQNPEKDVPVRIRMRKLIEDNPRSGCPMVHDILRREGLVINRKRTERIYYREEKLSLRRRKRRRRASHKRLETAAPKHQTSNGQWTLFMIVCGMEES